jgi:hypothetical protein
MKFKPQKGSHNKFLKPIQCLLERLSTSVDDTFAAFIPSRLAQIIHITYKSKLQESLAVTISDDAKHLSTFAPGLLR